MPSLRNFVLLAPIAVLASITSIACQPQLHGGLQQPIVAPTEPAHDPGTKSPTEIDDATSGSSTHWVDQIGGSGMEQPTAMFVERDGSIVVLGHANACTTFGVVGVRDLCPRSQAIAADSVRPEHTFLARWDADGRLVDAAPIDLDIFIGSVVPLGDGTMVVAGNDSSRTLVLVWLDRRGVEQRRARIATGIDVLGLKLSSMPGGGFVIAGALMGGRLDAHVHTTKNGMDVFVARLAADGRPQWTRILGGGHKRWSPDDTVDDLAVAPDGSIWVMGGCRAERMRELPNTRGPSIDCGDLDTSDLFFAHWSKDGALLDLQQLSSAMIRTKPGKTWHSNFGTHGGHLVATPDGGVVWSASFDSDARFGRGDLEVKVATRGQLDVLVGRFAPDGALAWWQHIGGPGRDFTGGLALDADEQTWVLGAGIDQAVTRDTKPDAARPARSDLAFAGADQGIVVEYDRDGAMMQRMALAIETAGDHRELRPAGLVVADAGVRALLWFAGGLRFPLPQGDVTLRGRGGESIPDDLAVWAFPRSQ